jgi:hypothetical protein
MWFRHAEGFPYPFLLQILKSGRKTSEESGGIFIEDGLPEIFQGLGATKAALGGRTCTRFRNETIQHKASIYFSYSIYWLNCLIFLLLDYIEKVKLAFKRYLFEKVIKLEF